MQTCGSRNTREHSIRTHSRRDPLAEPLAAFWNEGGLATKPVMTMTDLTNIISFGKQTIVRDVNRRRKAMLLRVEAKARHQDIRSTNRRLVLQALFRSNGRSRAEFRCRPCPSRRERPRAEPRAGGCLMAPVTATKRTAACATPSLHQQHTHTIPSRGDLGGHRP